jgi:alanine racemase
MTALRSNLSRLLADDDSFVLDVRADAYGHGASAVVMLALDAGVRRFRVSPADADIAGVPRSALSTAASSRPLISDAAYGVDGASLPVMTLTGEVVAVKPARAGAGVSYGYSYRTPGDTTLALVALGYADGVPRLASNRASVSLGGALYPLVGRIAMDQFVVDLGAELTELTAAVAVGDAVVLFGDSAAGYPLARDWGAWTQRGALELSANLGSRIERIVHD